MKKCKKKKSQMAGIFVPFKFPDNLLSNKIFKSQNSIINSLTNKSNPHSGELIEK